MGQSPKSSSYNTKGDGIPFFQGNADFGSLHPTVRIWCNAPTKIASKGDLLLSVRAPIGALNIAEDRCCIGRGLAALTPNSETCNPRWLFYAITSKVEELKSKGTGSTFKAISKNSLLETYLPYCEINEQNYIASQLDKVVSIIAKRKQQLAKLDQLAKARFVEMFGDPITNPMGWEQKSLGEVATFVGGSQPPKSVFSSTPQEGYIRLIQIRDYKTDKYQTYIPKALARRFCDAKDIMIGRYGPPIFQILQGINGAYNVALMKAVPIGIHKEFLRFYLRREELLRYLESFSTRTAGQDGVQMDKLKAYPCPLPPLSLQNEFASFIEGLDGSKAAIRRSLEELNLLYRSLLQEYFG